jgi:hypothetical protein
MHEYRARHVDSPATPMNTASGDNRPATASQSDQRRRDEHVAFEQYARIHQQCSVSRERYSDPNFPATAASLGDTFDTRSDDQADRHMNTVRAKNIVWRRPTQIFTVDGRRYPWSIFADPHPSDIIQGVCASADGRQA